MIDNDKYFDELLDEFVSSFDSEYCRYVIISPDDKLASWNQEFCFVDYRSNGVAYNIPKLTGSPRGTVGEELTVSLSDDNFCKRVRSMHESLYLYESLNHETLTLSLGSSDSASKGEGKLLMALYRQGESMPLTAMLCDVAESFKPIKIECKSDLYTYGQYFLLVCGVDTENDFYVSETMGGNLRFDFSLLPHGEVLEHPVIKSVNMKMKRQLPSEPVFLQFKFDRAQTMDDEYIFYCMADNYRLIGREDICSFNKPGRRSVTAWFVSDSLWVKGVYTIFALHNGEPFCKVKFRYDGAQFELVEKLPLVTDYTDYLFVKHMLLSEKFSKWSFLAAVPGYTACKEKLLSGMKSYVMDDLRVFHRQNKIRTQCHYCIDALDEDFLRNFIPVATDKTSYKVGDCNKFIEERNAVDPYELVNNYIQTCSSSDVMVLKNVGALLAPAGKAVLSRIESWLGADDGNILFLCGSASEIRVLVESSPLLQRCFPSSNFITREFYTLGEQVYAMQQVFIKYDFLLSGEAEQPLIDLLERARTSGVSLRWRSEELEKFFLERIYPRVCERAVSQKTFYGRVSSMNVGYIYAADLDITFEKAEMSPYETAMNELAEMVGLNNLKQHLNVAFNNMKFDEMRRDLGLSTASQTPRHMIFTGNPGTGKTTVAKKIGRVFHALGLLSKGDVIVTERTQLVGNYLGDTERNMQRVLEQARGNVLFIDEAYTLCSNLDDRRDFGRRVIEALLTVLSQPNPDMLIILAGYKKEMDRMMLVNQGLEGRFPYKFHFDDYSEDELMQIAVNLLAKSDYKLLPDADEALRAGIRNACANKDAHFSNARWVQQLVMDGVVSAMSSRVMCSGVDINRETLTQVCRCDVDVALEKFGYVAAPTEPLRRCVGFSY